MKRILVPTDFSQQANKALKVAAQIARRYDCEIFLVHLLDLPLQLIDPMNEGVGGDLPESLFFMKLAHKKFSETFDEMKYYLEGIKVHETVEFDEAFDGIISIAKKHKCDLIVMGSNGSDGLQEIFIGSNTEKVVRFSQIPVLVIKEELPVFKIDTFIFVSNLSTSSRKAFREALNFSELLGVELQLVYINTPHKFKTTAELDTLFNDFTKNIEFNPSQFHIYNDATIELGIRNFAFKVSADLVGIGTHGRKGISHFMSGSLAEDVINHMKKPIITFKI
ncbi:universal stress protein [Psychroflexus sediminis]|uniref:Nucleotide-binding universal stress protein, UspA family n=1 Tax=Psychroflexus sediminis TaxID=470826 RepID=A0A1G7VVM7_9FLAO|nr:universal stress protein [Psychroflexus sediminis]SDG63832.1 Nucleotide-binding universal stress protein, UspA family [Psychroflexus sediminis]